MDLISKSAKRCGAGPSIVFRDPLWVGTGNLNVTCDTVEIQLLAENPTTLNKLFSSYRLPRRTDGADTWI